MLYLFGLLILIGVIIWGALRLIAAFGVGEPIRSIVYVLLVVVAVILLLDAFNVPLPSWVLHPSR